MDADSITFTFRLDRQLKAAFDLAARSQDLTASQLLRSLMRKAVANQLAANAPLEPLASPKKAPQPPRKAPTPPKAKKPAKHAGSTLLNALLKRP